MGRDCFRVIDAVGALTHPTSVGNVLLGRGLVVHVFMAAWLVVACSSSHSDSPRTPMARSWFCQESGDCACNALAPGTSEEGSDEVDACSSSDCCLLTQTGTADTSARCECLATANNCEAEAKSRRDTQVVSQCPPPGEAPEVSSACAAKEENCRPQYLSDHQLSGCCTGTVCKPNADQVPVCQTVSASEQKLAQECAAVAKSTLKQDHLDLSTPTVHSSVGDIALPPVEFAFVDAGPGGCLNSVDITLSQGSGSATCNLELSARVSGGKLVASKVFGDFAGCDGYSGDASGFGGTVDGLTKPPASFSFGGLVCDGGLVIESYCDAGSFDFLLDGVFGNVSFADQHITLTGVTCALTVMGACPTP